jgi:hypothetical protein
VVWQTWRLADYMAQFIVMFRSRFHNVFPKSLPHYGPQDIERDVAEPVPGEHVEKLLCALLGLVLNRKKDVEYAPPLLQTRIGSSPLSILKFGAQSDSRGRVRRGHFQRALEEAVQTHQSQWPPAWNGKNPTHGGGTFTTMTPVERVIMSP